MKTKRNIPALKTSGKPKSRVRNLGEWSPNAPETRRNASNDAGNREVAKTQTDAAKREITIPASIRKPSQWKPDGLSLVLGYVVGIAFVWLLQAFVKVAA